MCLPIMKRLFPPKPLSPVPPSASGNNSANNSGNNSANNSGNNSVNNSANNSDSNFDSNADNVFENAPAQDASPPLEDPPASLEDRLKQLMAIAAQYPLEQLPCGQVKTPNRRRQRALTEVTRLATPKLWRQNVPYYSDALHQVWLYVYQRPEKYDPKAAGVVTWLNMMLRYRIKDLHRQWTKQSATQVSLVDQDGREADLVDPKSMVDCDLPNLIEAIRAWAEVDEDGALRQERVRNHPEVTSQRIILERLILETPWHMLAEQLNAPMGTVTAHYYKKCIPRLQRFCRDNGYC
jgi:DNA-directed RNA polymerase specialized sigma24 family protein